MRFILQGKKHVFAFEMGITHAVMEDEAAETEEFEHAPMDPHGTSFAQIERRPEYDFTADMSTIQAGRRFGFGLEEQGDVRSE